MLSVLAVGLCLVFSSSVMSSETVQRSLVVLIGERVELKCSVTGHDSASWKYTPWNSSTEISIYLGRDIIISMRSRYTFDKNTSGHRNLITDPVDLAHAGRYRCTGIQQSLINDVQLIVLGSHPVCSGNTSEAAVATKEQRRLHLAIWCSVNYTGNGFPVFNWTKSNVDNSIHVAANTITTGNGQVPFTSTSLITQQLQANDSGVTFHCLITFQTPNISPENTSNDFNYTWNYTLDGPINLSIVEHKDHLECSADSNPIPNYKWIDVETNMSIAGSVYTFNLTNNTEHTISCTAENIFASKSNNYTIKDRAKDSDPTSDGSNSPIGLITSAIAGTLVVLLIMIIIFGCVVYRKRLKGDSSARPDVALNTDLTSYESDGRMISDNAVYAKVCKPKDDIALSSELSPNYIMAGDPSAGKSDGRMISDNAVYAEVCPSTGNKGRNIGDNSQSLQHPTRDLIGDDGTEYVNTGEGKSTDRKGVRHVSDPTAFSHETIYTSIDHSGRVPRPPLPTKW